MGILFGCSRGGPHACRWTLLLRRINRKWQSSCVNMSYSTCLLWAVAEGKPPLKSSQAPPAALSNPCPLPLTPLFIQRLAFILMEPNEHSHPYPEIFEHTTLHVCACSFFFFFFSMADTISRKWDLYKMAINYRSYTFTYSPYIVSWR